MEIIRKREGFYIRVKYENLAVIIYGPYFYKVTAEAVMKLLLSNN